MNKFKKTTQLLQAGFLCLTLGVALYSCSSHEEGSGGEATNTGDELSVELAEPAVTTLPPPPTPVEGREEGYRTAKTTTKSEEHNTEDYAPINENSYQDPKRAPFSTFSIDVDAASYANMRRFINEGTQPVADAIRVEEMVNYFNYQYPQPGREHPFSINTEISACPWNLDHQLVHIGLQGKDVPKTNLPPSNLVFLLDVSGSMSQPNKLPLLKQGLRMLTDQLRPQDHVAIVVYAGSAGVVLPSTPGDHKMEILNALDRLEAGGSTAGAEGIALAYQVARENFVRKGNNRVILATDGDFNVGQSSDAALERQIENERESGVYLTVLGFGTGNYQDSKMQTLADKGNGNHAYIDNALEAKKVLVNEFGGTLFTIAKDVKIQVEFNPEHVKGYRLIGYENRMLAAEDFNNDKKDAGELGSGHTVTALYEIIPAGSSEELPQVDASRYQNTEDQPATASNADELMFIKFRYKKPTGNDKSILINHAVKSSQVVKRTSENFRWSAAVASFGLLLRNSEYKGTSSYESVLSLAKNSIGEDYEGYRQEFIGLVKRARDLSEIPVARRD